jgi:hypothetical protein
MGLSVADPLSASVGLPCAFVDDQEMGEAQAAYGSPLGRSQAKFLSLVVWALCSLPSRRSAATFRIALGESRMKITRVVDLHADAGWRVFSFLKIETDAGIVGWSEYNEKYGSKGLTAVILNLAETLIGKDPRPVERVIANLHALTRQAPGGLIQQAIAAIENALVDVKAKALGFSVSEISAAPCMTGCASTGRIAALTDCTMPTRWVCPPFATPTISVSSARAYASAVSRR